MKKNIILIFAIFLLFIPVTSRAQTEEKILNLDRIKTFGDQGIGFFLPSSLTAEGSDENIAAKGALIIASPIILLIQILYGFLATILVLLILKGGYIWLTSEGNEEKTRKAKDTIKQAITGFSILLGSVIIIYFILLLLGQINVNDVANLN